MGEIFLQVLAQIYKSKIEVEDGIKELYIDCPAVQQQKGSVDCGVFAIAFAFHLGKCIMPS